ncbi:MAG: hypothetical protein WCD45_07200, partial [Gallionella sp.]
AMTVHKIKNGVVVLLDALGVSQFDLEACVDFLDKREEILEYAENHYLLNTKGALLNFSLKPIITATFGDTLLFAWDFDGDKAASKPVAIKFLAAWLAHILSEGIRRKIYYRGAMSSGELLVDTESNTVIGSAVVDASNWYEQADWIGVIATPSCGIGIEYFESVKVSASENNQGEAEKKYHAACINLCSDSLSSSMLEDTYSSYLRRCSVPLKGDKALDMWVVAWPSLFDGDKNAMLGAVVPLSKLWPKGVETKYENTIKFFDDVCAVK